MPRPKRYTLEEIARAIEEEAGTEDESERQEFARKLFEHLAGSRNRTGRPLGRPPEKDEKELLAIARLVRKGNNPHAAARQVTAKLPESKREAARQRLYRKFNKDSANWLGKAAIRAAFPTIQEEIERLRELLGPGADRPDYGELLRRRIK
jgi:hypothetical protein